jgi:hypothetical protein
VVSASKSGASAPIGNGPVLIGVLLQSSTQ